MRPRPHRARASCGAAQLRAWRGRLWSARWSLALALTLCTAVAHAEGASREPVRVQVAPRACVDAEAFYSQIAARTLRTRPADADEAARVLIVQTLPMRDGYWGRLTMRDANGAVSRRELRGSRCKEVVEGLALVAALAIDPSARLDEVSAPSTELPADAPSVPAASDAPFPSPNPPTLTAISRPQDVRAPGNLSSALATRPGLGVAAQGVALTGRAPVPLWGGGLALDWRSPFWGALQLHAALSAHYAVSQDAVVASEANARFAFWGAALQLCPLGLRMSSVVRVEACTRAGIGAMQGEGSGANIASRSSRRLLVDAGFALGVVWELGGGWALQADAAGVVPLRRDVYGFGLQPFYTVAPVGAVATIGMRWRLL